MKCCECDNDALPGQKYCLECKVAIMDLKMAGYGQQNVY